MEDRVEAVTVRVVAAERTIGPISGPEVAVMMVEPATPVAASPLLLTVPVGKLDEIQVTRLVMSKVVPSEYAPEAVNCWKNPEGTKGLAGVM